MTRISWTFLGLILMVVVGAAVMRVAMTGEEERVAAGDGAGAIGEEGHGARGAEIGGAGMATAGIGDQGVGRGACLEEGEASDIGGDEYNTFQDLPELSSRSRPSRLRQGTIFEMFKAERGHRRQSGEGTNAPAIEEEELGSDDDDDTDFDMEAKASREEEEEEEQEVGLRSNPPRFTAGQRGGGSMRV